MPIPEPRGDEGHDEFIGRCHEAMADEVEDRDQRHAICEGAWRDKTKMTTGAIGMELEHKAIESGVEVKDAEKGIVEAIVARINTVDADGDIFLPGAFGEQKVRVSAYNHKSWPSMGGLPPVGKGVIRENGDAVTAELQFFMGTASGREHFEMVKAMGDLQQWSYGWPPGQEKQASVSDEQRAGGIRRAIKGVPVVEVSPVLLAATTDTRTVAVKGEAGADDEPGDDLTTETKSEDETTEIEPETEVKVTDDLREEIAAEVGRYEILKHEVVKHLK